MCKQVVIKLHIKTVSVKNKSSVSSFLATDPIQEKVMAAEVKLTVFLAENHLPMAVADQASRLFKSMFPDSQIAKKITCGKQRLQQC